MIREWKRHLNKPDQQFDCERLWQDSTHVVLRYVTDRAFRVADAEIPAGSMTLGLYEPGSRLVFWKMIDPDGHLIAYLGHLCHPIEIEPDRVIYQDRMLDIWQAPPESPALLDEDDLEAAVIAGQISQVDADEALAEAKQVVSDFSSIVERAEAAIAAAIDPR